MIKEHVLNIEHRIENHESSLENNIDTIILTETKNDGLKFSDRGRKIISILKKTSINVDDIATLLGTSKPTVEREISVLEANKIIDCQGSKKSKLWLIIK